MYRILYHHRTKALDGQRVHIREVQDALRRLGHEVVEVSPLPAREEAGAAESGGVRRWMFERISDGTPRLLQEFLSWSYNVVAFLLLVRAIRRVRPDFLYERYALNTLAGIWACRLCRIPLVLEVNSPLAREQRDLGKLVFPRLAQRVENYVISRVDRVIVVTAVLRQIVLAQSGVDPRRVVVVHNGVRPEAFTHASEHRQRVRAELEVSQYVVVGAVAFFLRWHGIDRLIDWLATSTCTDLALLLVGDGQAVPELREQVARLGLTHRVRFTGPIPHGETPRYIAAMDVAVLPGAVTYASPLKLFEYLAAGIPIVAPRQPNLLEVLEDGVNAVCFQPENPPDLQRALARLLSDVDLQHRISRAGPETIARAGLTWDENARRIVRVFESVDDQQRPRESAVA